MVEYFALKRRVLDVEGRTIRDYREVYDAFFEEMGLIRRDRSHEIHFEDLERDTIGQMRGGLRGVGPARLRRGRADHGSLCGGALAISEEHLSRDPATRERMAHEWRRCFEAWGYPA